MKAIKVIFSVCLFLALQSTLFGQRGKKELEVPQLPMDSSTMQITYREVVEIGGTQAELFKRFTDWVPVQYKTTSVIEDVHTIVIIEYPVTSPTPSDTSISAGLSFELSGSIIWMELPHEYSIIPKDNKNKAIGAILICIFLQKNEFFKSQFL